MSEVIEGNDGVGRIASIPKNAKAQHSAQINLDRLEYLFC